MSDNTLVIIGNGFDLNHGLNASFGSFYKALSASLKNEWNTYMNRTGLPSETWHDFETIIGKITNDIFNSFFDTFLKEKSDKEREIDK